MEFGLFSKLNYQMQDLDTVCSVILAHLSRRLIGELIGYSSGPASVRRSQCSNIFFSETAEPIKAKLYVGRGNESLFAASGPISTKLGM